MGPWAQPQLMPTSTAYGYKALARVALVADLLIVRRPA